jgi:pimeloyl-ACP methyl ester carboxylesterase
MNEMNRLARTGCLFLLWCVLPTALSESFEPLTRTLDFRGTEREYFVALPRNFDPDATYWALVVVHGGGGGARTNTKAIGMRKYADEMNLPSIVIMPRFITEDKQVSRFPVLGEDGFLKAVLADVGKEFRLHPKILLTGYSMGGQFSHRFAFTHPDLVYACAPLAAGTWSTPDGRLLIEQYGEVENPGAFLLNQENAGKVPERLRNLFDRRTAEVAGLPAADGADRIPFLVMCGTLDSRLSIAKDFAACLQDSGFVVETAWPRTPHGSKREEFRFEFDKYPKYTIQFFKKVTEQTRSATP